MIFRFLEFLDGLVELLWHVYYRINPTAPYNDFREVAPRKKQ